MNDNYINAAKKGDRKPIALIGIESPDADVVVLTTQADWESGTVDSSLDTTTNPGSVALDGPVNSWTSLANLPGNRMLHSLVYYNGKIYLFGGAPTYNTTTNTLYEYNVSTGIWSQKTSCPVARAGHTAVVYNGKMYIHGGFESWGGAITNTLYECDLSSFIWVAKTSGGQTYGGGAAATVHSNNLYVFGGQNPSGASNNLYKCNLATFVWTKLQDYSRYGSSVRACVKDDDIFVGVHFRTTSTGIRDYHIAKYDIATGLWSREANYPISADQPNCFELIGEKIIIHSFYDVSAGPGSIYEYYIYPKIFVYNGQLNTETSRYFAESASNDGIVYIAGGQTSAFVQTKSFVTCRRGYTASGTLVTDVVDMGIVPSVNTSFYIDDTIPADTAIAYTAKGSATGAFAGEETALGSVADGASLSPFQYYQITAVFSTTEQTRTPTLKSMSFYAGSTEFVYYSTDHDNPIRGAKPYVKYGSISASNSEIALLDKPKTGEVSAKLFWTKDTGNLIATGNLKNKAVLIKTGFDGILESDFVPFFTGTWYDYVADPIKMEITLKFRDIFKQFSKVKYPFETVDGSGNKTTTPVTWTADNVIQVMQDIFTALDIPDRYIDTPAFNTLKAGARSGTDWEVTRTLSKPEPVLDLLNELAVIAGVFLVPMPTGELTPKLYSPADAAVATFDADNYTFSPLDGGQASLYTRQLVYYAPTSGHPGTNESDYSKAYIKINATQESAWNETAQRNWYEKWNASAVAIQALADRMDTWFAAPKITTRVNDVPPRFIDVDPGAIVAVDNLRVPVASASWPGKSAAKKFLVLGKRVNPAKTTITFDLLEV